MKKPATLIVVTLVVFALYYLLDELYFGAVRVWFTEKTGQRKINRFLSDTRVIGKNRPCLLLLRSIGTQRRTSDNTGYPVA